MPIRIHEESGGEFLNIHVSGKLVKADYAEFVPAFDQAIKEHGKVRVLFEMEDFHGWDVGAAWEDLKLDLAHFNDIDRLAMVGENKWHNRLAVFFKPFTRAEVRYFDRANMATARVWLEEGLETASADIREDMRLGR